MDKPHITPLGPNDNRTAWHRGEVAWLLDVLKAVEAEVEEFPSGSLENFTALTRVSQTVAEYGGQKGEASIGKRAGYRSPPSIKRHNHPHENFQGLHTHPEVGSSNPHRHHGVAGEVIEETR